MKGKSLLLMILSLLLVLGLGGEIGGLWEEARAEEPAPPATRLLASPVSTAFTYQGRLVKDGNPVNGTCDFLFTLWDSLSSLSGQVGGVQSETSVSMSNGIFTVQLNGGGEFGASAFTGEARWLLIALRCPAGSGDYTPLSPRQELTATPYALALPGLWTQQNAESPNLIGGYSGNSVTDGREGATIGGGGTFLYPNSVTEDFGTVGGGLLNTAGDAATVGGGQQNTATGPNATVGGGTMNTATTVYTTVGGGSHSEASGPYATVGGGHDNDASGDFATVPGGMQAEATHYGQLAYASGRFADTGDAQTSVFVMRIEQTCLVGVWYDLYLDGNDAGPANYLTITDGRTMVFDTLVVGRSNAGESAGYYIWGVVENVGGTATLVNWWRTLIGRDDAAWDVRAATLNDALFIQVKGNGETIRWVATMRTAEVAW